MSYYTSDEGYEYEDDFEAYPVLRGATTGQEARRQRFEGVSVPTRQEIENKRAAGRGKPINRDRAQGNVPQVPANRPTRPPPGIPARQMPAAPNMAYRQPAFNPYDSDAIMEDPSVPSVPAKPAAQKDNKPKGPKPGSKTEADKRTPRQSELQILADPQKVFKKMMDTQVSLQIGELFGVSKPLSNMMQDAIRPKQAKTNYIEEPEQVKANLVRERPLTVSAAAYAPSKGSLIKLDITCNGRPITAIVDTGSQLNIIHKQIWKDVVRRPRDLSCSVTMNDANGGEGLHQGCVTNIPLMCGTSGKTRSVN